MHACLRLITPLPLKQLINTWSKPFRHPDPVKYSLQALKQLDVVIKGLLVSDLLQLAILHPVLGRSHLEVVGAGHGHAVGSSVVDHQAISSNCAWADEGQGGVRSLILSHREHDCMSEYATKL